MEIEQRAHLKTTLTLIIGTVSFCALAQKEMPLQSQVDMSAANLSGGVPPKIGKQSQTQTRLRIPYGFKEYDVTCEKAEMGWKLNVSTSIENNLPKGQAGAYVIYQLTAKNALKRMIVIAIGGAIRGDSIGMIKKNQAIEVSNHSKESKRISVGKDGIHVQMAGNTGDHWVVQSFFSNASKNLWKAPVKEVKQIGTTKSPAFSNALNVLLN